MRTEPTWRIPIGIIVLILGVLLYAGLHRALSRAAGRPVAGAGAIAALHRARGGLAGALAPLPDLDGNRALALIFTQWRE